MKKVLTVILCCAFLTCIFSGCSAKENEATWPQTQEYEHTDGDFAFLKNYIKENAAPGYKLAYNATWAQPVAAELYKGDHR